MLYNFFNYQKKLHIPLGTIANFVEVSTYSLKPCTSYPSMLTDIRWHQMCQRENFSEVTKLKIEIDRYGFFEADTDISKILKSCFLLHYQNYNVFYALPFFQNLKNQDL